MKNKIKLLFTILNCIAILSCNKNTNEVVPAFEVKTNFLSKDSNFKKIIELENSLSEEIENILYSKKITKDILIHTIDSLTYISKSDLALKLKMNEQIAPGFYETLIQFKIGYKENWTLLTDKYIRLSSKEINSATIKYFESAELNKINIVNKKAFSINNNNIAKGCGWGYSICLAGATAGAILCHASCIGATAGLGTPVCVLLCGTVQVAIGVECMRNYCEEN